MRAVPKRQSSAADPWPLTPSVGASRIPRTEPRPQFAKREGALLTPVSPQVSQPVPSGPPEAELTSGRADL